MSQMRFRPLIPKDLARVSEIESQLVGHPRQGFLEKRFKAMAAQPGHFITCAALDQERLVGYAFARIQEGEFGHREVEVILDVIGVSPDAQAKGLGKAMLGAIKAEMGSRNLHALKTQIAWSDRKMVHFFASVGFNLAPGQILQRDTSPLEEKLKGFESEEEASPSRKNRNLSDDYHDLSRDLVQVRSLRAEDLAEVVRIDHSLTGRDRTDYYSAKFQELLTGSGIRVSLVSEEDGVPTGYVMARVDFGEFGKVEKAAVIDTIGVHPAFKGSGIGHALLSQLLLNLSSLQVESVLTQVAPEDFHLHRFLHACGFQQSQRLALTADIQTERGSVSKESRSQQVGVLS